MGEIETVSRQAESDAEEVRLPQRHLVGSLDPPTGSESALIDEQSVDPDQPAEFDLLGVVGSEDRRPILAVPQDHLHLIGRTRVGERREGERECEQQRNQQKFLHPILLVMAFCRASSLEKPYPDIRTRTPSVFLGLSHTVGPYLMRRVRVQISGHVQGVFFRVSCARRAEELGLAGWVRNASVGRVEAVFEGDGAEVEAMLGWCRKGPPHAEVDRLEVVEETPTGAEGFRITH